jgi:hypothetical protein
VSGPIDWAALTGQWRRARAVQIRRHAGDIRGAYSLPAITEHTYPYADDLDRAADVLDRSDSAEHDAMAAVCAAAEAWRDMEVTDGVLIAAVEALRAARKARP